MASVTLHIISEFENFGPLGAGGGGVHGEVSWPIDYMCVYDG